MNAPWSLRTAASKLARGWNDFFHQPCDARICAAVRIAFAATVLLHWAVLYPDLDRWFTAGGVLPREFAKEAASVYSWSLLWLLPDTSAAVHLAFWLAVGHTVALLIGLLPRINAFFLFLWIVSFQVRNQVICDGEDTLMRMLAFFLIWLPSGQAWSLARLVKWGRRARPTGQDQLAQQAEAHHAPPTVPGWPIRLLQFQMAAMFLSTGLMKLGGEAWLNGTALYYVSRLSDHFGRFWVPAVLFDTPWIVAILTWSVLVAELTIPILIWFRETRLACLIVLVCFHLANEWTMNLFLFHPLMLCGWLAFVAPGDFRAALARLPVAESQVAADAVA